MFRILTQRFAAGCFALIVFVQTGLAQQQGVGAGNTQNVTGRNASAAARSSGVTDGPQLGGRSSTVTGLGGTNRIDRTSTTNADNPRTQRGPNILSGDAAQQGLGQTGRTGQTGFTGTTGGGFQGGRNNNLANQRRPSENRAQYSTRIAFPAVAMSSNPSGVTTLPIVTLQETLSSLPHSSIHVAFDEGVVVLRGKVATESDRRVAERMAKLEPGVGRVRNELELSPSVTEL